MENTYNYLKTAFQELKIESKQNPAIPCIVLLLCCIPLSYAFGSIALAIFFGVALFTFKKSQFHIEKALLLPMILYLLMIVSLAWTYDFAASLKALSKEIPLLLVPVGFMMFPVLNPSQKNTIIRFYSHGILLFVGFYLLKAIVKFIATQNANVFFYHELVTEDVNAIHVSVYVAIAAFYFITKTNRTAFEKIAAAVLVLFMILLSSKNIAIVFAVLLCFYIGKRLKKINKRRLIFGFFLVVLGSVLFSGKIKARFNEEYLSNTTENKEAITRPGINNLSIYEAWHNDVFQANDYFPGTAFRVYQIRIFTEMLQEDAILFTGYGLNASDFRVREKGEEHRVFSGDGTNDGYQNKNFHNEYIQVFAELGLIGFLILLSMLIFNTRNAIKTKDFIHISFSILMISLFLTESFLSRQRGIVFFTVMYCLFNSPHPVFRQKTIDKSM